jgi:tetratricopeptide (TPR) repeat protein
MKKLLLIIGFCFISGAVVMPIPNAYAFLSPHPIKVYEKGINQLSAYRGNEQDIREAQRLFNRLIERYPDSPLGYLGLSQAKILEAYRYDHQYNMKVINDEALPMALKAMHFGPTLNLVQDNYDRFEKILEANDEQQDHVRRILFLFPEKAETYLSLGNYFVSQGDFSKAAEYYKVGLNLAESNPVKLKAVQRLAWVYHKELNNPGMALPYYEAALQIRDDLPSVHENIGQAYLELNQYGLSIENFKKVPEVFETSTLRSHIWEAQGFLYEEQGRVDLAIDAVERALEENNENTSLHYHLGNLYYKQEDFEKAYRQFSQVIEAGTSEPSAFYFAGRAAHSLGQDAVAKDYYSRYLQLKSDGQEAEWIRQNIPDLSHR